MTTTNPELDHYKVLGVERDATHEEIEDAYALVRADGQVTSVTEA